MPLQSVAGIEALAAAAIKRPRSVKEKERRVLDFKQRVCGLLELYVARKKGGELMTGVVALLSMARRASLVKTQKALVRKVLILLRDYVRKANGADNQTVQEAIQECLAFSYKTNEQDVFALLKDILLSLMEHQEKHLSPKDYEDSVTKSVTAIVQQLARNKTVLYNVSFFKAVLKRHPCAGSALFKMVVTFVNLKEEGGASNDRIRMVFLEMLHYLLSTEKEEIKDNVVSYQQTLCKALSNIVASYKSIQWKRNSIIKQTLLILAQVLKLSPQLSSKEALCESLEASKLDDKAIDSQRLKLILRIQAM